MIYFLRSLIGNHSVISQFFLDASNGITKVERASQKKRRKNVNYTIVWSSEVASKQQIIDLNLIQT